MAEHFPQISTSGLDGALLEPEGGVILARGAVRLLVQETLKLGGVIRPDMVDAPEGSGTLDAVRTSSGDYIRGEHFVFACGPWMPRLFPSLLADRMHVTRQDVFFFGPGSGDRRFSPPELPVWMDFGNEVYGVPDLQRRGAKFAFDRPGPPFDPDTDDRHVSVEGIAQMRAYVGRRFPALANATLLESRVCQYSTTSNADFLVARHPSFSNVWLVGGGSGHGFKHAPAVAQHLVDHVDGKSSLEVRFSFETKDTVQPRLVF
jgi:glycine/D-amino acid oxidase-like deaminating enzyme